MASLLRPRSDALIFLLLALSLLASASLAPPSSHFEGFDSDDLDASDDLDLDLPRSSPSASTITLSSDSDPQPEPEHEPSPSPPLEYWDEEEFEGFPQSTPHPSAPEPPPPAAADATSSDPPPAAAPPRATLRSYTVEIICITFLIAFTVNFFLGRRQNENIALSWASKFATRDSIFEKNFSLLGTGDGKDTPLLLKEGQDVFKFYASGRRFCQGMLATMELRSRHDLISRMIDLVLLRNDTITFEVVMNDDAMDHVVLALARKKAAKAMHKDIKDLQRFASPITVAPSVRKWISEELSIVTESKEVAGDLITDAVLDQVFGEKAFEKFGKYFISLHFSDQQAGSHRKLLFFKFTLPDANNMAEITKLVTLVPYYIDLVGRYKLSSQARSKTEATRAKAVQELHKELQNTRLEALQKKKAEKKKLMEESETKLSAEAIHKKEEKERARQMKKAMPRVKMLR